MLPATSDRLTDVLRYFPPATDECPTFVEDTSWEPLLDGARGKPKADIPAIARALSALSRFGTLPRVVSAEVNPLMALPDGAVAADAVIELG